MRITRRFKFLNRFWNSLRPVRAAGAGRTPDARAPG